MTKLFNFHNLLQIRFESPDGPFRHYCELEFSHGKQGENWQEECDIPTLNVSLDSEFATEGAVWSLGKGLFYNEVTQEILVSRDRGTSFFEPNDIYVSLTSMFHTEGRELSVKFNPEALYRKNVDGVLRDIYRRFVRMDPRSEDRKQAETFVSQFLEPNIFRLFLKTGHVLVHAAALEKEGQGILIFGPQNVGKTTVAIELSRNGWNMLGDDLCLLNEDTVLLSYAKPLKLERELLKTSPELYGLAMAEKKKCDSALAALRPSFGQRGGGFEIKVPASSLGISIIETCRAKTAFFLQRAFNVTGEDEVVVEKLSGEDAIALCEQHIAAEYDVNKHVDRDIRQNMGLHLRAAESMSMVSPQVSRIISKSFLGIGAYMIGMNRSGSSALETIERIVSGE